MKLLWGGDRWYRAAEGSLYLYCMDVFLSHLHPLRDLSTDVKTTTTLQLGLGLPFSSRDERKACGGHSHYLIDKTGGSQRLVNLPRLRG